MGAMQWPRDTCIIEDDVELEHKLLEFFNLVVSHGFKSLVECVLVGNVGLNFYTVLDKAS
jgi:hypothetical protein